jgi:hypothetical protein
MLYDAANTFGLAGPKAFWKQLAIRLEADYVSHMQEYLMELIRAFKGMGSFWHPPEQ